MVEKGNATDKAGGKRLAGPESYINMDVIYGRATGTCCWGCARKDDCPMEAVGRRCTKNHTTCPECTWWGERGCYCFAIDKNLLKM